MKKIIVLISCICFLFFATPSCNKLKTPFLDLNEEMLSGGGQTVFDEGSGAYSHAFANMPGYLQTVHEIGDKAFEQTFVAAPAPIHGGLGPLYNNVSCVSCHIGDGRGKVPLANENSTSILFRVSTLGNNNFGEPNELNGYGNQIQHRSINSTIKEGDVVISYTEKEFQFDDGEKYNLRFPTYTIINNYIPVTQTLLLSPRIASPVFGLGLLEAIDEFDILQNVDEFDSNNDGISGKANYVWNISAQQNTLGKFGWKANQPTLLQQVAGAYNGDMGITNFIFSKENSFGQIQYDGLQDDVELSDSLLHAVEFYIRTLAVPARRNIKNLDVAKGKQLFIEASCGKCHVSNFTTKVNVAFSAISNQQIFPYTDLLLHDMGNDLADNRPDFLANGKEWRTPPLWGIGLTETVNGHSNFLHDGRARNLMEAIMWHGGEAEKSKNKVSAMSSAERKALLKFLESL
jgi:CxxC motif-containing protein (DUF1111 family)